MRRQLTESRTSHKSSLSGREEGFTLVEVLVALALVTVLAAVGVAAVSAATRAIARGTQQARWNMSVGLLDSVARRAFAGFPPAFWASPPALESSAGEYRIVDRGDQAGYSVSFRFVQVEPVSASRTDRRTILVVSYGSTQVAIPGVRSLSLSPLMSADGRVGGYQLNVAGAAGRSADLKLSFGGQYL